VPTLRNQKKKSKLNRVRRKEINKDQSRNLLNKNQGKKSKPNFFEKMNKIDKL